MKKSTVVLLIVAIAVAAVLIYVFTSGFLWGKNAFAPNFSESPAVTSQEPSLSPSPLPAMSPSPTPTASKDTLEAQDNVKYKDDKLQYDYYDVAEDQEKTVIIEVGNQEQLQYPLSVIADQYFNKNLDQSPLKPNSVVLMDNKLHIDFTNAILTAGLGSSSEDSLLNAIADIYLNNIDGLNAVYISVAGRDYSSGHIEFSKDQPYKTRSELQ
jgi:disulfide oxidoreductase YuzD